MNETRNLKLGKPLGEEYYDIEVFNRNFDIIDEAVSHKATKTDLDKKIDRAQTFNNGNLVAFDSDGNLRDSNRSINDIDSRDEQINNLLAQVQNLKKNIEEQFQSGIWTPEVFGQDTRKANILHSAGFYVKAGNYVNISAVVTFEKGDILGDDKLTIKGLPFVPKEIGYCGVPYAVGLSYSGTILAAFSPYNWIELKSTSVAGNEYRTFWIYGGQINSSFETQVRLSGGYII